MFFLFFSLASFSQRANRLSKDTAEFVLRLPSYMVSDPYLEKPQKDALKEDVSVYLAFYDSLPPAVKETVAEIAVLSVRAKVRPYPDLWHFFQAQQQMQEKRASEQPAWFEALRAVLKKNKRNDFRVLVDRTKDLLGTGTLYDGHWAHWRVSNSCFRFEAVPEPSFYFGTVNVSCSKGGDSSVIYGCSGRFFPLENVFEGRGGKLYWSRVGLPEDTCWAELLDYSLALHRNLYEADAFFYNKSLFQGKLAGRVTDRMESSPDGESLYPSFQSRDAGLVVKDILKGVDAEGAFAQRGSRVEIFTKGEKAVAKIMDSGIVRAKIESGRIVFDIPRGRFSSPISRFVLYMRNDSLHNSLCHVDFDGKARVLYGRKAENIGLHSPYIDTYHRLRMDFELLRWHIDRGWLEMGLMDIPGREGVASFSSLDMYSRKEVGQFMMGLGTSPLHLVQRVARLAGSDSFSLNDLASYIQNTKAQALAVIRDLVAYGYVAYDPSREKIELLPQFRHTMRVLANRADFDELEFVTGESGKIKATMDLDSLVLNVFGVSEVLLSRRQNMYVHPKDSTLKIYKNRNFHFDGFLNAGTFNFEVNGGNFDYDKFMVDIADIRQLGLKVKDPESGEGVLRKVVSNIQELAAKVYIDDTSNKGGLRYFPDYPILESVRSSYVYYDDSSIQGGVYTTDSFYFRVDPFRIPNLNTIDVDSIRFPGVLVSADILPDIRDALRIMPDYSLGFDRKSPEKGWPAYRGKARFDGCITLNSIGLHGDGDFAYMSSIATSRQMVFRPHDMEMRGSFVLLPRAGDGVDYPWMEGKDVAGAFWKDGGIFKVSSSAPQGLDIFDRGWQLQGSYVFSPDLSWAEGVFHKRGEAHLYSTHFEVSTMGFASDSSDFILGSLRSAPFLESPDYSVDVNLTSRTAYFKSNEGSSPIRFGIHQYEGKASAMYWDMDKAEMEMVHDNLSGINAADVRGLSNEALFDAVLPGSYFESVQKRQFGLGFNAQSSTLYYSDTLLQFDGVIRLLVADAMLLPSGGRVVVSKAGTLMPLVNAELFFGDRSRLHSFHGVTAVVANARQYQASGSFRYKGVDVPPQDVFFAEIRPRTDGFSLAEATLASDTSTLMLNEAFRFRGKVRVDARQTYPFFAGSTQMVYACDFIQSDLEESGYEEEPSYDDFEYDAGDEGESEENESQEEGYDDFEYEESPEEQLSLERGRNRKRSDRGKRKDIPESEDAGLEQGKVFWPGGIRFEAYINSDSVRIPVDARTRSTEGQLLGRGFYTSLRGKDPRLLFLQHRYADDFPNISVSGWLSFLKEDKAYAITDSSNKVLMKVSLNNCNATVSGLIDLRMETDPLTVVVYGNMSRISDGGRVVSKGLSLFDFYMPEGVAGAIAEILNAEDRLEGVEIGPEDPLVSYLEESLGPRALQAVRKELTLAGTLERIPEELSQSLVFSNLILGWDSEVGAYVSKGISSLLSVGGHPISKKMKTYILLQKKRSGDAVDIYLEASRNRWFYFSYANEYMTVLSSDEEFNQTIEEMRGSKRKKGRYEFFLASPSKKNTFVRRFEERWGGQE